VLSNIEARKRAKQARAAEWGVMLAKKPSSTTEDPQDSKAIRVAETQMGDYKLKRDRDYVVLTADRVDAAMKHHQIESLQRSLNRIKMVCAALSSLLFSFSLLSVPQVAIDPHVIRPSFLSLSFFCCFPFASFSIHALSPSS
jgi:hypothetical protein